MKAAKGYRDMIGTLENRRSMHFAWFKQQGIVERRNQYTFKIRSLRS
jgi:hypothetical protein